MRVGRDDFTGTYNWTYHFYVISDAWCTHCEETPPKQAKHAGYLWNLRNENANAADLFLIDHKDRHRILLLISKNRTQVAIYKRGAFYPPDESDDSHEISIQQPVGRLEDLFKEYHEMKKEREEAEKNDD